MLQPLLELGDAGPGLRVDGDGGLSQAELGGGGHVALAGDEGKLFFVFWAGSLSSIISGFPSRCCTGGLAGDLLGLVLGPPGPGDGGRGGERGLGGPAGPCCTGLLVRSDRDSLFSVNVSSRNKAPSIGEAPRYPCNLS